LQFVGIDIPNFDYLIFRIRRLKLLKVFKFLTFGCVYEKVIGAVLASNYLVCFVTKIYLRIRNANLKKNKKISKIRLKVFIGGKDFVLLLGSIPFKYNLGSGSWIGPAKG